MDWNLAIQHNQTVLLRNVAWLFTWLKLEVGGSVETMSRLRHSTVLFVLRPSESACRRLILVAVFVWGTTAVQFVERVAAARRVEKKVSAARDGNRAPAFRLIDPRKAFDLFPDRPKYARGPGPRITVFGSDDPVFDRSDLYAYQERLNRVPSEDVNAARLCARMNALVRALEDLPKQAQRMVALQDRMKRRRERTGKPNLHPLRPGLPPGFRRRQKHEVDEVLAECHQLVRMAEQDFGPPEPG